MDERSDRRFQLLIAVLVLVVLTLIVLALPRLVTDIRGIMHWSLPTSIVFNAVVMIATAIIIVGHVELRPLVKTFGFVVLSKVVQAGLTALGFMLTMQAAPFTERLLDAGLMSWSASVLHAVGTIIIAWLLRDMLLGSPLRMEGFPEGIILPGFSEPEPEDEQLEAQPDAETAPVVPGPVEQLAPAEAFATEEPPAAEEAPAPIEQPAPAEPLVPEPVTVPIAGEPKQAEDEDELDRVVATAAPVTQELESLPDQTEDSEPAAEPVVGPVTEPAAEPTAPAPVAPSAGTYTAAPDDIVLTVDEVLGCFKPEDVAMSADDVRRDRGGDDEVRVPLDVVLPQIENGMVLVEPWLIFDQLPRSAFARPHEQIAGHLWRGCVELPLARVVAQLPGNAMQRTYERQQESVDEFADPFEDALDVGAVTLPEPMQIEPIPPRSAPEPVELEEAGVSDHVEAGPAEAEEPEPIPVIDEAGGDTPVVEVPVEKAPAWSPLASGQAPEFLTVSAEYVIAQFPEQAMTMPIEDIEATLEPRGKLRVPADDVLPQLAEGTVAIDVTPLLEQLPPGAIGIGWSDLRDALPEGKVELPLEQLVGQIPSDMLAPGVAQVVQDAADEIPEPFHERAEAKAVDAAVGAVDADVGAVDADVAAAAGIETAPEAPAPPEPIEEAPVETAAAAAEAGETAPEGALEIAWTDLLPQFPPGAFIVDRERLNRELAGRSARVDMHIVRPQLGEGRVTVPCGYLLAQFPGEYLELTVEQITDQVPDGRFELPLVSVVLQLPEQEFALPEDQAAQEATDELPTVFAEPGAERAAGPTPEEAPEAEAAPAETAGRAETAGMAEVADVLEGEGEAVAQEPASAESYAEQPEEVPEQVPEERELTESEIEQLESLLAEKRRLVPTPGDEGDFLDDAFEEDEAPAIGVSTLETEVPTLTESSVGELFDSEAPGLGQAEPVGIADSEPEPAETEPEAAETELEYAVEDTASFVEAEATEGEPEQIEAARVEEAEEPALKAAGADETEELEPASTDETAEPAEAQAVAEPVEDEAVQEPAALETAYAVDTEAAVETGEPVEQAPTAPAETVAVPEPEAAVEPAAAEAPEPAATAEWVDYTRTAHGIEAFCDLVHEYAKFHVEHGNAYLDAGLPIFSFTPVETGAEELAVELRPRIEAVARFAAQLGCGTVERAVLTADRGAIVCERLTDESGGGLVLIATTDTRAVGLMHLETRRHTELLATLSAELWPDGPGAAAWPQGEAAAGCEVAAGGEVAAGCEVVWPDGHPYDEVGGQLAAYNVEAIALLRFASGPQWMLASSVPLEEAALAGEACYNPSELVELPESLRLGRIRSALVMTDSNIITINAPAAGGVGLVCVFPSGYREGLLRMKAEKASALLCQV